MTDIQSNISPGAPSMAASTATAKASAVPLSPKAAQAIETAKSIAAREVPAVNEQALQHAVADRVPELKSMSSAKLELDIDQDSGRVVGRVIDQGTGELIRQIPTEEMLSLIAQTKEMLGALYDTSV